jgi:lysophospholipase L1-like esterase
MRLPLVRRLIAALVFAVSLSSCSPKIPVVEQKSIDMGEIKANLEALSKARILMGHQSVGRNVIAGLQELATELSVPLRIVVIDGVPPDLEPGVFHSEIGENGDPEGKCEVFSQLLTRPDRPVYDLAMMKFCYADLRNGTPLSVEQMLERYTRLVESLKTQRPDVRLVHITLPLKAEPPGRTTTVKRFVGMSTEADADNSLRNSFNAGLQERVAGEPLFDLAAVESTRPDGSRAAFVQDGQIKYMLAREYTEDGGHLNQLGRRRAAIEFVRTLAAALRKDRQ